MNPDLIMLGFREDYQLQHIRWRTVHHFLATRKFVADAAIRKEGKQCHVYFLREDSDVFEETTKRLLCMTDTKYLPLDKVMRSTPEIPLYKTSQALLAAESPNLTP